MDDHKHHWAEREAEHERRWAERAVEDARRNTLVREAAKQPVSGTTKSITLSFEIDATGLTDEMIETIIRPGAQDQAASLAESWQRTVARHRQQLERERWAHAWSNNRVMFTNVTLDTLRERLLDDRGVWHTEHATGEMSYAGTWFHSGDKKRLHVHSVRVDEEHRGKGYGRKLMELLILRADLEGFGLELRVDPANAPAVRLYESLGFVVRKDKKPYHDSGIEYTFMVRRRTVTLRQEVAA